MSYDQQLNTWCTITVIATQSVLGVFFYSLVTKMISGHLLHTQHQCKEDLRSLCRVEVIISKNLPRRQTKLKGQALNYRVDGSVVKHVRSRDVERRCFLQKNWCPSKGGISAQWEETSRSSNSLPFARWGSFLSCSRV